MLEFRGKISANFLQVFSTSLLHFNLTATVLRVDIVKHLFSTLAGIEFDVAVKELVDVG